jgi:hypothetical protein
VHLGWQFATQNVGSTKRFRHGVGALPVVRGGYLAGIITERDADEIAGEILAREAGETPPGGDEAT